MIVVGRCTRAQARPVALRKWAACGLYVEAVCRGSFVNAGSRHSLLGPTAPTGKEHVTLISKYIHNTIASVLQYHTKPIWGLHRQWWFHHPVRNNSAARHCSSSSMATTSASYCSEPFIEKVHYCVAVLIHIDKLLGWSWWPPVPFAVEMNAALLV